MSQYENGSHSTQTNITESEALSGPDGERLLLPEFPSEGLWSQPNADNADVTRLQEFGNESKTLSPKVPDLSGYGMHPPTVREFFSAQQKWVGFVTEAGDNTFRARITTMVGEGYVQDAEIYSSEVDVSDRVLIKPGAMFYWSIGYLDRPSGRFRTSIIRFRRLPVWTDTEVADAKSIIEDLKGLFGSGE